MKFANLHLHSTYSDAGFTPRQLVLIAKSLGYGALALTDHETHGGVPEVIAAAKLEGLDCIPGVEFHCKGFHITALDFDMNDPGINAFIKFRCEEYAEYTRKVFERGLKMGYYEGVTWDDVLDFCDEGSWICNDHLFNFFRRKKILAPAESSADLRNKLYNNPEAKSFYPVLPSIGEIIGTIRKAGGIACLAHPYMQTQYVPELMELGLNGIEVSHPDLDPDPDPYAALKCADAYKLYKSGGTDHTGPMSCCGGKNAVPAYHGAEEEDYYIMKERRLG